ncbi:MAG: hypothetical protein AB7N71_05825 [Phycisphaerae bacterium]
MPDSQLTAIRRSALVPASAWPYLFLFAAALLLTGWGRWGNGLTPTVVISDGMYVVALLASAAGWGAWPAKWLARDALSCPQQFALATALGLGVVGFLTLLLGASGLLSLVVAWGLLGIGGVLGLIFIVRHPPAAAPVSDHPPANSLTDTIVRYVALATLTFPLALLLFVVTLPPGVLWSAEGRGYDVLEYHLQVPREYFEAGSIHFLPHNVYASFPQQVEILYLLLMHLIGDPWSAAVPAQILHAALGALAVFAIAAFSEKGAPRLVALLLSAGVPWMVYLGALAYVELGILYFSAVAGGLLWRLVDVGEPQAATTGDRRGETARQEPRSPVGDNWKSRLLIAAGICAGLAAGCKYTAIVLVIVGLAAAYGVARRSSASDRIKELAIFALAAAITFSPWLIRNVAFTGNPVFPFAYEIFGGAAWSESQHEQWTQGHEAKLPDGRIVAAWNELFASRFFGPALLIFAGLSWIVRRDRAAAFFATWSLVIVAAWIGLTHMPGRFAVPLLVPLAYSAGHLVSGLMNRSWLQRGVIALAGIAVLWNTTFLRSDLRNEEEKLHRGSGLRLTQFVDQVDKMLLAAPLNELSEGSRSRNPLIIGDAAVFYVKPPYSYTVVFNRNEWLSLQEQSGSPTEAVKWLQEHNISHVMVDWNEVKRLRDTYGISAIVTHDWRDALVAAGLRPCCTDVLDSPTLRKEIFEVP